MSLLGSCFPDLSSPLAAQSQDSPAPGTHLCVDYTTDVSSKSCYVTQITPTGRQKPHPVLPKSAPQLAPSPQPSSSPDVWVCCQVPTPSLCLFRMKFPVRSSLGQKGLATLEHEEQNTGK